MTRGQRVLSLLRSAARATAQQGATISEASSINVGLRAFTSTSRAAALAGGPTNRRICWICRAGQPMHPDPVRALITRAGARLGAGLWQQQLPLSACGVRSISLAALKPSDK